MAMIGQRPARGFDPYVPEPLFQTEIPPMSPALTQAAMTPPAGPAKPKINWLGVLADALSGAAGQPGMYAQTMREQRREQSALERGEQQYQRQRADSRDDFLWKQQHEQRAPSEFDSLLDAAGVPTDQRPGYYKQMLERKINPDRWVFDPVRGYVNIGATPTAPTAPVGKLTPLGGQSQPATGGFRY